MLAACEDDEPTTTTAADGTDVTAGPEQGRAIKLGICSPQTGNFAVFATADDWYVAHAEEALKDGIVTGDGKLRQVEIVVRDTQSDSNRAAQVAGDLVLQDNVDMLLASGTPDTCNPVAGQGEALGCPNLHNFSPWQALYLAQDAPEQWKWTYSNFLGSELTIKCFTDAFDNSGVQSNKKVGMLFQNDADAQGWMAPNAAPKVFAEMGYELVVPDYYSVPAEDFTKQISTFKSEGCELICGTNDPPWFSNFLGQSLQQGYQPKFISSGKALIMPEAVLTYPNTGLGLIGECAWHPSWKIKDTLSDMDSEDLAADYEAKTGNQWSAAIAIYAKLEWAIDVYKRATDPEDKESVVEAILATNNTFQAGPIDFTQPVDPAVVGGGRPHHHNVYCYFGAQQWRASADGGIEAIVVSNACAPGTPVQDKAQPMEYA
jgi:branched-chain amino acid transport system substrate-binding protein